MEFYDLKVWTSERKFICSSTNNNVGETEKIKRFSRIMTFFRKITFKIDLRDFVKCSMLNISEY
jgi:hypothetical protein